MFTQKYLQLNVCVVLFMLRVQCDSKSVRGPAATTKLTRLVIHEPAVNEAKRTGNNCQQLPDVILVELLGEAYNSRYMSVNRPIKSEEALLKSEETNRDSYSVMKRKADETPSFYVDEKHMLELSDKPAWEVKNHAAIKRKRRSIIETKQSPETDSSHMIINNDLDNSTIARFKRAYGRGSASSASSSNTNENKQLYPWKCEATVKWVDLGPDYFPRYLRNIECTKQYCWYKVFMCKPKSFAVKILHRRRGKCAEAGGLKKISSYDFRGDYGEVWSWEEVAINFCCDCAIA